VTRLFTSQIESNICVMFFRLILYNLKKGQLKYLFLKERFVSSRKAFVLIVQYPKNFWVYLASFSFGHNWIGYKIILFLLRLIVYANLTNNLKDSILLRSIRQEKLLFNTQLQIAVSLIQLFSIFFNLYLFISYSTWNRIGLVDYRF